MGWPKHTSVEETGLECRISMRLDQPGQRTSQKYWYSAQSSGHVKSGRMTVSKTHKNEIESVLHLGVQVYVRRHGPVYHKNPTSDRGPVCLPWNNRICVIIFHSLKFRDRHRINPIEVETDSVQ